MREADRKLHGVAAPGKGPRWVLSFRALVVVLALAFAVTAILWLEQAKVSGDSADLHTDNPAKVLVPPVDAEVSTSMPTTAAAGQAPANGPGSIVVHVVGAVKNPGIVSLAAGSRVYQAIDAAGGALAPAQLSAINLATLVEDGTQIMVPTAEQAATGIGGISQPGAGQETNPQLGATANTPSGRTSSGLVNLNTASVAELDTLPGVGPVMAQRIVQWRSDHGLFTSVDQLNAISGIGPKMLSTLQPLVSIK